MGVIQVLRNHTESGHTGELDERAQRRYVVRYFVETDDPLDGTVVVANAAGIPRLFDVYIFDNDQDLGARCKRITATRSTKSRTHWIVECEFDSMLHDAPSGNRDPLLRPPEVSWDSQQFSAIATNDKDGRPIVNAALDEFDPPPEKDDARFGLVITRNELNFDDQLAAAYTNVVNSDTFFNHDPGEAKINRISSSLQFENNQSYWRTTYEIQFRRNVKNPPVKLMDVNGATVTEFKGWDLVILNQGLSEYPAGISQASGYAKIIARDNNGRPFTHPVRLDNTGKRMFDSAPRTDSWFVVASPYPEKPFSVLNLP